MSRAANAPCQRGPPTLSGPPTITGNLQGFSGKRIVHESGNNHAAGHLSGPPAQNLPSARIGPTENEKILLFDVHRISPFSSGSRSASTRILLLILSV